MTTPRTFALALLLAVGAALPALPALAQATAAAELVNGEVRKVDKANSKLTIKHEEIKNLDMPGMTMVFQVKAPAVLETLKPGDKVRFRAEKGETGGFVVTEIQPAK